MEMNSEKKQIGDEGFMDLKEEPGAWMKNGRMLLPTLCSTRKGAESTGDGVTSAVKGGRFLDYFLDKSRVGNENSLVRESPAGQLDVDSARPSRGVGANRYQEWRREKEMEASELRTLASQRMQDLARTTLGKEKLSQDLKITQNQLRREREESDILRKQIEKLKNQLKQNEKERKELVSQQLDAFKQDATQVQTLRDELRVQEDEIRTMKLLYGDDTQRSAVLSRKLGLSSAACEEAVASEREWRRKGEELLHLLEESKIRIKDLEGDNEAERNENYELQETKTRLEEELKATHRRLNQESADAVDCRAQATACVAHLQKDLEKVTANLEETTQKLNESQRSIVSKEAAMKELKMESTARQMHIDKLFDELSSMQADVGSSAADHMELKIQVDGLTSSKEIAEEEADACREEMHRHIDVFDEMSKRNEVFKIKEEGYKNTISKLQVQLEDLKNIHRVMCVRVAEAFFKSMQLEDLKDEHNCLCSDHTKLKDSHVTLQRKFQSSQEVLEKQVEDLKQMAESLKSKTGEIKYLNGCLSKSESTREALENELAESRDCVKRLEEARAQLMRKLDQLGSENRREVAELKSVIKTSNARIDGLEKEVGRLESEVGVNKKTIEELSHDLACWKKWYHKLENSSDENVKSLSQEIRMYEERFAKQKNSEGDAIRTITKFIDEGHIPKVIKSYHALGLKDLIALVLESHQTVHECLEMSQLSLAQVKEQLVCEEHSSLQCRKQVEYLQLELSHVTSKQNYQDIIQTPNFQFPDSPHMSRELTAKVKEDSQCVEESEQEIVDGGGQGEDEDEGGEEAGEVELEQEEKCVDEVVKSCATEELAVVNPERESAAVEEDAAREESQKDGESQSLDESSKPSETERKELKVDLPKDGRGDSDAIEIASISPNVREMIRQRLKKPRNETKIGSAATLIGLTVEVARLRGALKAVESDLERETGARKLREKFAEGTIRRLKEIEEHQGLKLLEGLKRGEDTGVQTHYAEIWAYSGGRVTQGRDGKWRGNVVKLEDSRYSRMESTSLNLQESQEWKPEKILDVIQEIKLTKAIADANARRAMKTPLTLPHFISIHFQAAFGFRSEEKQAEFLDSIFAYRHVPEVWQFGVLCGVLQGDASLLPIAATKPDIPRSTCENKKKRRISSALTSRDPTRIYSSTPERCSSSRNRRPRSSLNRDMDTTLGRQIATATHPREICMGPQYPRAMLPNEIVYHTHRLKYEDFDAKQLFHSPSAAAFSAATETPGFSEMLRKMALGEFDDILDDVDIGVEITDLEAPDLHFILLHLCESFGIKQPPRLFLFKSMESAVYYMDVPGRDHLGNFTPPILVVASKLLDVLDHYELEAVLAGALVPCISTGVSIPSCSHAPPSHRSHLSWVLTLTSLVLFAPNTVERRLPIAARGLWPVIQSTCRRLWHIAQFSADRVSILVADSYTPVLSAMLKMSAGLERSLGLETLLNKVRDRGAIVSDCWDFVVEEPASGSGKLRSNIAVLRGRELFRWMSSASFRQIKAKGSPLHKVIQPSKQEEDVST